MPFLVGFVIKYNNTGTAEQLSWHACPVLGATFPLPKEVTTDLGTEYLLCICNVKKIITVDYNGLRFLV